MNIKEEILLRTNKGLEIFCFYMPIDFVIKRNFRNPLYDDKRASCNIYLDKKSDCYRMKDFGNDAYSGDCFWFAATMIGLDVKKDFVKVLETIIRDLQLKIYIGKQERFEQRAMIMKPPKPTISQPADQPKLMEEKKWYKLIEQSFSIEEMKYWQQYGIDSNTLQRFHVKSLAHYESISNQGKPFTLGATHEEPMFAYNMRTFVKIYRPKSKLRFLYGGEKVTDYVFCFQQLPSKGDIIFITGGEGTGKSNYIAAILAGTLGAERLQAEQTLGLEVTANPKGLAVLHYDTEQSEAQLHKNLGKTLRRAGVKSVPEFYHSLYLASLSRKDRLKIIRESMDLFHHKHGGIHLVVIDGIADLIRSANDETDSIAIVDKLYRLAGIYNTCIICVLHFVPNGIKLRGHIGSELQRKAAGILSIEKDDNPKYSVVKALKVRDGSPLDVPMMLFGWDKQADMHVYRGEKSKEDKERRKADELIAVVKEIFLHTAKLSYKNLSELLIQEMEIKDRTAKRYIAYMREQGILSQDTAGNYQKGERCRT